MVSIGKEKVEYTIPPDTVKKYTVSNWRLNYIRYQGGTQYNFTSIPKKKIKVSKTMMFLSAEIGFSVPSISYHDAIAGTHLGAYGTYYFNSHIGITAKAGVDLNGTGLEYISDNYWGGFYIFQEYMAGLSYRTGGRPSYPWVDFVFLGGICNATNPVSESGTGVNGITVTNPGNGSGYGGYLGLDFTSSENHLCSLTFGIGCTFATFNYPNYVSTSNPNYISTYSLYDSPNTTYNKVTPSTTKMNLALFQMHFSINFRVKKATY